MNDSMPRFTNRCAPAVARSTAAPLAAMVLAASLTGCPAPASDPAPAAAALDPESLAIESEGPDWAGAFDSKFRFDNERQAVMVDLKIASGFHAYTVGEATGKPLAVSIAPDGGYELNGEIQYPKGKAKQLPIGPSVIVEGDAQITVPVARRPQASGDRVKGTLRYQVCTKEACDRPRKLGFEVPATGGS